MAQKLPSEKPEGLMRPKLPIKLPASLKHYEKYIEEIEDYRSQGPDGDGYWVHLKPGWINVLTETHAVHEDNITQCLDVFKLGFIIKCECGECLKLLGEI